MYKSKYLLVLILLLFAAEVSYSQTREKKYNSLSGQLGFLLDGGFNLSQVDKGNKSNLPTIRRGFEYFFSTKTAHAFGIRLLEGYNFLRFKDMEDPAGRNFVYDAKLGLEYAYGTSNLLPYASVGLNYAYLHSKKSADNNKKLSFYGEIGMKYLLSQKWNLNFALTGNLTGQDYLEGIEEGNTNDAYFTLTMGLVYAFSKDLDSDGDGILDKYDQCPNTPSGVKIDEFGCPIDTDKDGVADYLDKCPNTPKGVKVDKNGCPLDSDSDGIADYLDKCPNTPKGVKVDKNGCPLDSDGDGVADYLDKCPNTPKDVKVDKNGCPLDSDGDGVADYLDKCPNTPAGVKVDKNGCPVKVEAKAYQTTVYFELGRSGLTKEAQDVLYEVIKFMDKNPNAMLSIEGHASPNERNSMRLSERRANSVYNYLVRKGIDKNRLVKKAFGSTQPVTRDRKEFFKNRRVLIIEILKK